MPNTTVNALSTAVKGLSYQSETDAPWEAFLWKKPADEITEQDVLQQAGKGKVRPVRPMSLDDFFQDLTAEQDWHGDDERVEVKKYRNLVKVLREHLADVQVFKIGEPQVDIYIVGKTKQGDWAGLRTSAVET